ncbi:MAG: hypothetical protein JWN21_586 [Sphingomonas bacterium]|uniref:hypothetical protein n=1 Tax=Sphingomonas bacterium TaxID=1895847 RepID=UPI002631A6EF|nr:hypothetical protein [Sphingomonas bacterium]MDB5695043.1 hypothetical protein [Sphingomonas bacterium]
MRIALAAVALTSSALIAAAPAVAREPVRPTAEQAAAALGNPLVQEAAARALTQLVGIVLDTRVGPAAMLSGPDARVRPDDTLRDLAQRDDPYFEERLYEGAKRSMGTAAAVAGGAAVQAKELKRTADRLEAALAPLLGAIAPERY